MKLQLFCLVLVLLTSACGGGSSAATCDEFAREVEQLIDGGASGPEFESFIEDSEEQVAKLISKDPDAAGPCVEAVLGAAFASGFAELESLLDG